MNWSNVSYMCDWAINAAKFWIDLHRHTCERLITLWVLSVSTVGAKVQHNRAVLLNVGIFSPNNLLWNLREQQKHDIKWCVWMQLLPDSSTKLCLCVFEVIWISSPSVAQTEAQEKIQTTHWGRVLFMGVNNDWSGCISVQKELTSL